MKLFRLPGSAIVAVALISASSSALQAQRFGITAGATFSSVKTSDDLNLSNRTGSTFGITLQIPAGQTFTLQPELLFINKGAKFNSDAGNGNFKLDYVEIPLLLRYDFSRGVIGPHIYAGPSAGFSVGCTVSGTLTSGATTTRDCSSNNFKPKSLDYGITAGAGVDFNLGGIAATGGVRYGIGLADIRSDNSATFRNRVHNGVLSLYVGVLLGKPSR
ncbi:MAG: PorT family protein [Gemmatimonadota bacterium]|nr:PorT family protein [Gemmatimonadota bacterium]